MGNAMQAADRNAPAHSFCGQAVQSVGRRLTPRSVTSISADANCHQHREKRSTVEWRAPNPRLRAPGRSTIAWHRENLDPSVRITLCDLIQPLQCAVITAVIHQQVLRREATICAATEATALPMVSAQRKHGTTTLTGALLPTSIPLAPRMILGAVDTGRSPLARLPIQPKMSTRLCPWPDG
jgi:hypothetical protein